MQGRDEYELDYYGGAPVREEYSGRMPGEMRRDARQERRPIPPRESCCQSRINELLEEMERFEAMQSEELRRITAEIRRVCGAIDGRGCAAIEGEPDREMIEMLMEQVMDRLDQMPGGMRFDEAEMVAAGRSDGRNRQRNLVEALLWQELLRRRMRRKRRSRRWY